MHFQWIIGVVSMDYRGIVNDITNILKDYWCNFKDYSSIFKDCTRWNYKGGKLMLADRQEIRVLGTTWCLAYNFSVTFAFCIGFRREKTLCRGESPPSDRFFRFEIHTKWECYWKLYARHHVVPKTQNSLYLQYNYTIITL